jgi:hypothetical protein
MAAGMVSSANAHTRQGAGPATDMCLASCGVPPVVASKGCHLTDPSSAARRLRHRLPHSTAIWRATQAPTFRTPAGSAAASCYAAFIARRSADAQRFLTLRLPLRLIAARRLASQAAPLGHSPHSLHLPHPAGATHANSTWQATALSIGVALAGRDTLTSIPRPRFGSRARLPLLTSPP